MAKTDLTAARLRELLHYDPETGFFTWMIDASPKARKGSFAGSENKQGHLKIQIANRVYLSHRLAWLYVHGVWPVACIDHINRVKSDNRLINLREASVSENAINRIYNSMYLPGTQPRHGKWTAQIKISGKKINLGTFCTEHDAHLAYVMAKNDAHPRHPFKPI